MFFQKVLSLSAYLGESVKQKDAHHAVLRLRAVVGWTAVVGEGRNWPRTASVSLKINLVLVTQMCVYDTINCVLISCYNK